MILRYDAVLNGKSLGHIAPSIIVRDIDEKSAKMDTKTVQRAIRPGMRVTQQRRQSLEIVLHCNVRAYGGADRAQILDEIADWVQDGGWLEISTRPGKRLRVTPTGLPSVGSSLNWTGNIDLTFTAKNGVAIGSTATFTLNSAAFSDAMSAAASDLVAATITTATATTSIARERRRAPWAWRPITPAMPRRSSPAIARSTRSWSGRSPAPPSRT
jgi:hypothetical protein